MIDTASKARELDHWIHLTAGFKSDLAWWCSFLDAWNGRPMMQALALIQAPHIIITTDASGNWGCGAFWLQTHRWIQRPWQDAWHDMPIHTKELLPILLAAVMWGPYWRNSRILVKCNNMAVVNILATSTSRDPLVMHLLRTLHFISAFYSIHLIAQHIAGNENTVADAIFRNILQVLFFREPEADLKPTPIPEPLWDILVTHQPDWLSGTWRISLTTSLATALHQAQEKPTPQPKQGTSASAHA